MPVELPMELREYQQAAVDSVWQYFFTKFGNPLIALPTGTGKSLVIAGLIRQILHHYPGQRIVVLTHVKELIDQNYKKLVRYYPTARAGIYSAGLGRKDYAMPVTFAGIQSICKYPALFKHTDLIIIDEAHLVGDNANASYQTFIAALLAFNKHLKVIGLTATPYRLGKGMLTNGGIFTDICFDLTNPAGFRYFLDNGYLAPLLPRGTDTAMDLAGLHTRGGEYVESEMAAKFGNDVVLTTRILEEALAKARGRDRIVDFTTSIANVEMSVAILQGLGVDARGVHSEMGAARDENIRDFVAGKYRWVVNKDILTTGFDCPEVDCIVGRRPTQSPGLWVQMLGRGTRPAPGKDNCIVLDFAGNSERLGPVDDPVIPKEHKSKGGPPPMRQCKAFLCEDGRTLPNPTVEETEGEDGHVCRAYNHISKPHCTECGAPFLFESKLGSSASDATVMESAEPAKPKPVKVSPVTTQFPVTRVLATRHIKDGSPDSLKVTFMSGRKAFYEYVPLAHPARGARYAAEKKWAAMTRDACAAPATVEEALEVLGRIQWHPKFIMVLEGTYNEIIGFDHTTMHGG